LSEILAGGGGTTYYGPNGYEKLIRGSISIRNSLCPQPISHLQEIVTSSQDNNR